MKLGKHIAKGYACDNLAITPSVEEVDGSLPVGEDRLRTPAQPTDEPIPATARAETPELAGRVLT